MHQASAVEAKSDNRRIGTASRHIGLSLDRDTAFQSQLQSGHRQEFRAADAKTFFLQLTAGACPVCHGLGQKMVFDEALVVPDPEKSLERGAVLPWRRGGKRMIVYYKSMLRGVAAHYEQSLETPYKNLPEDFKQSADARLRRRRKLSFNFWRAGKMSKVKRPFEGVIPNLERLYAESESEFTAIG